MQAPPRQIGFWTCLALVIGNTIGTGIFLIPAALAPFAAAAITGGNPFATTMMACPPPLDEADRWVQKLFAARPRWHLDGDVLTLATDNLRVTLVEQSADR